MWSTLGTNHNTQDSIINLIQLSMLSLRNLLFVLLERRLLPHQAYYQFAKRPTYVRRSYFVTIAIVDDKAKTITLLFFALLLNWLICMRLSPDSAKEK